MAHDTDAKLNPDPLPEPELQVVELHLTDEELWFLEAHACERTPEELIKLVLRESYTRDRAKSPFANAEDEVDRLHQAFMDGGHEEALQRFASLRETLEQDLYRRIPRAIADRGKDGAAGAQLTGPGPGPTPGGPDSTLQQKANHMIEVHLPADEVAFLTLRAGPKNTVEQLLKYLTWGTLAECQRDRVVLRHVEKVERLHRLFLENPRAACDELLQMERNIAERGAARPRPSENGPSGEEA